MQKLLYIAVILLTVCLPSCTSMSYLLTGNPVADLTIITAYEISEAIKDNKEDKPSVLSCEELINRSGCSVKIECDCKVNVVVENE